MNSQNPQEYWDEKYSEAEKVWSGNANATLVHFVSDLPPGTALDLGCGEGGDAIWLAKQGWHVTATDISQVALDRAAQFAKDDNVTDKIMFEQNDLSQSFPAGTYDLVAAHFVHMPEESDTAKLLKTASKIVNANGVLLIVDHSTFPQWRKHEHKHNFPSAQEIYDSLELDKRNWEILTVGTFEREALGAEGQRAMLKDSVVFLKKRRASSQ
jgi:SAM-dependent methyltransferase